MFRMSYMRKEQADSTLNVMSQFRQVHRRLDNGVGFGLPSRSNYDRVKFKSVKKVNKK